MLSPRNKIEVATSYPYQVELVDTLYEICDAEFNSRADIHNSFKTAKGVASWTRYFLLHEVRHVAAKNDIYCSYHMAYVVAKRIAEVWFEQEDQYA